MTLPGRGGDILADLEGVGSDLAELQVAAAGLDILGQHRACRAPGCRRSARRFAEELGIGQEEVRGRERVAILLDVKARLLPGVLVQTVGALDQLVRPAEVTR